MEIVHFVRCIEYLKKLQATTNKEVSGDEGNDPTVYLADYSLIDDHKREIKSLRVNFSTFIEKKIATAFKIWEEGW